MANTKVTSRVLANDAVLTANITDANITTAKIADNAVTGDKVADDVALAGNPTTTTQTAGNNTTRIATTAFVTTAVANIVDSAPSALDTLNELAAALGDDANFSTTITNSIATKLPLAGGTMTGNIVMADDTSIGIADDAERIEFDGAGDINILGANLGIGTTSPSHRLTAKSDANTNPAIKVEQTGNTDGWGFIPDNTNGNLEFSRIGGGTEGTHLAITNSGNVGIGITSPATTLHLDASGGAVMRLQRTSANASNKLELSHDGTDGTITSTNDLILSATKVGVGTTDPDDKFHVAGGVRFNTTTADGDESRMYFTPGGAADDPQFILYRHDGSSISTYIRPGSYVKFENDLYLTGTNARMGMQGADPSSDISCHAGANGGTSTKWRWGSNISNTTAYFINHDNDGVYMTSGATGWSAHSDERMKENIKDIGSVLDKVKDYRCVEFNMKGKSRKMYGFIAQDWETDFPYLVDEDTGFTIQSDGTLLGVNEEGNTSTDIPKGIAYEETIPVLLKAIQEQQEQIETLKKEVEELKGG
jgi:hypothetical protein